MRRTLGLFVALIVFSSMRGFAQDIVDDNNTDDDWGLFLEDEPEKPKHKFYPNTFYIQYSPSQYHFDGVPHLDFNEIALGYFRSLEIMEDKYYYVELGAAAKYSFGKDKTASPEKSFNLFTLRVPINVMYKFFLSKTQELAIAPYAGVNFRAIVAGKGEGWTTCQLGWQAGVRFYWDRLFLGVSYSRDFPDKTKFPGIHECGVHLGFSF